MRSRPHWLVLAGIVGTFWAYGLQYAKVGETEQALAETFEFLLQGLVFAIIVVAFGAAFVWAWFQMFRFGNQAAREMVRRRS